MPGRGQSPERLETVQVQELVQRQLHLTVHFVVATPEVFLDRGRGPSNEGLPGTTSEELPADVREVVDEVLQADGECRAVRAVLHTACGEGREPVPPLLKPRDDAGLPRHPIPASQRHADARPVENGAPPEPGEDGGPLELERRRCHRNQPGKHPRLGRLGERLASGTVPGKAAGRELLGQEPAVATGARMGDRATSHRAPRPVVRRARA